MSSLRAFAAVLGRDVFVTGRELPSFLAQVLVPVPAVVAASDPAAAVIDPALPVPGPGTATR